MNRHSILQRLEILEEKAPNKTVHFINPLDYKGPKSYQKELNRLIKKGHHVIVNDVDYTTKVKAKIMGLEMKLMTIELKEMESYIDEHWNELDEEIKVKYKELYSEV